MTTLSRLTFDRVSLQSIEDDGHVLFATAGGVASRTEVRLPLEVWRLLGDPTRLVVTVEPGGY